MIAVYPRLWVGAEADCQVGRKGWATVHACKHPCHKRAAEYRGNLSPDSPHYLVVRQGDDLYLNLIDPPTPLFRLESFTRFLAFAGEAWRSGKEILIHCNRGESRAPSLALVFLSHLGGEGSWLDYDEAAVSLRRVYPAYEPGAGIKTFLQEHWREWPFYER